MLIVCDRHTKADLDLWRELEEADEVYYSTHAMEFRVARAIEVIQNFAETPFYLGVSWGKDSVTTLHMCLRSLGPSFPIVCARGTYTSKAANMLYLDEVHAAFPGLPEESYREVHYPEAPPHQKEKSLSRFASDTGIYRYVSGVRAAESGKRTMSRRVHGISTHKVCRPIIDWPTEAVFAYCAYHHLPLHPDYGMLGGGRWDRSKIRVGGSIGGSDGDGMGRAEWEREYYPDILARICIEGGR